MKKHAKSPLKHSRQLRYAGQSIDDSIIAIKDKKSDIAVIFTILFTYALTGWIIYYLDAPVSFIIMVSVIFLMYIPYAIIKIINYKKQLANLILGRDGEKEVAEYLSLLKKEGVHIIHDVINEDKTFNIDHVVVCPQGVFTIETKTYSKSKKPKQPTKHGATIKYVNGDIIKDGYNTGDKIIKQAQYQAIWLKEKLNVNVFPIIVFPGWWVESKTKNNNIAVINASNIKKYIESFKEKLSIENSNNISNALYDHVRMSSYD